MLVPDSDRRRLDVDGDEHTSSSLFVGAPLFSLAVGER